VKEMRGRPTLFEHGMIRRHLKHSSLICYLCVWGGVYPAVALWRVGTCDGGHIERASDPVH
jgi:hypothetical protein